MTGCGQLGPYRQKHEASCGSRLNAFVVIGSRTDKLSRGFRVVPPPAHHCLYLPLGVEVTVACHIDKPLPHLCIPQRYSVGAKARAASHYEFSVAKSIRRCAAVAHQDAEGLVRPDVSSPAPDSLGYSCVTVRQNQHALSAVVCRRCRSLFNEWALFLCTSRRTVFQAVLPIQPRPRTITGARRAYLSSERSGIGGAKGSAVRGNCMDA